MRRPSTGRGSRAGTCRAGVWKRTGRLSSWARAGAPQNAPGRAPSRSGRRRFTRGDRPVPGLTSQGTRYGSRLRQSLRPPAHMASRIAMRGAHSPRPGTEQVSGRSTLRLRMIACTRGAIALSCLAFRACDPFPHSMRASLSLHLALFRRQRARITRAVEGTSPAFQAYERRYRARIRSFTRPLTFAEVRDRALAADVVYVGDYHTLRVAQQSYRALVEAALGSGRRVVLALEFVEGRFQPAVDRYLRGLGSERRFLEAIGHASRGPFDLWAGFRPIFELARERGLQVLAIDRRAPGARSLALRDRYAGRRI